MNSVWQVNVRKLPFPLFQIYNRVRTFHIVACADYGNHASSCSPLSTLHVGQLDRIEAATRVFLLNHRLIEYLQVFLERLIGAHVGMPIVECGVVCQGTTAASVLKTEVRVHRNEELVSVFVGTRSRCVQ